jgi:7-cyano-7-deazaguanine synthase in queuosine biosynthesis
MTSTRSYELRGASDDADSQDPDATPLRWPEHPGATATVRSELGWFLEPWNGVPPTAIDLVRVAAGAYLTDRLTPRGTAFTRSLHLSVAVTTPNAWTQEIRDDTADLLHWLTGDQWALTIIGDDTSARTRTSAPPPAPSLLPPGSPTAPAERAQSVTLLSGGLDSFLGAVHLLRIDPNVDFLGHRDAATAVQGAQRRLEHWLAKRFSPVPSYTRVALRQAEAVAENTNRSRSLLFAALGVAAAAARGRHVLQIPENGYTSINLPLHPNRGGALSTRSTHPETFRRVNRTIDQLGLDVHATNPFQDLTKGEAMRRVADADPPEGWLDAAAATLSCSKLDGGRIQGGNPNHNCGLCVACLVRRGTFIAAHEADHTPYLVNSLAGAALDDLVSRRRGDIEAVRYAVSRGVDDILIDAGTWPPDHDLDATTDLVRRGLAELAAVPLP